MNHYKSWLSKQNDPRDQSLRSFLDESTHKTENILKAIDATPKTVEKVAKSAVRTKQIKPICLWEQELTITLPPKVFGQSGLSPPRLARLKKLLGLKRELSYLSFTKEVLCFDFKKFGTSWLHF